MKRVIFALLILVNLSANSAEYQIHTVSDNPVPGPNYVKLWEGQAIELCELNAKDYNIKKDYCPNYISNKFSKCQHLLGGPIPEYVSSKEQGKNLVFKYFRCISAWPHCNGHELRTQSDIIKYCN